jgi:hypothetical protein
MRVIHEYDNKGNHRIKVISDDNKEAYGRWVGYRNIATCKGFHATTDYFEGTLPVGVFRLNIVPHEVAGKGIGEPRLFKTVAQLTPEELSELESACYNVLERADANPVGESEIIEFLLSDQAGLEALLSHVVRERWKELEPHDRREVLATFDFNKE